MLLKILDLNVLQVRFWSILPKIRPLKNNPKNEIQKISKKINQKMYSEKLIELTKK